MAGRAEACGERSACASALLQPHCPHLWRAGTAGCPVPSLPRCCEWSEEGHGKCLAAAWHAAALRVNASYCYCCCYCYCSYASTSSAPPTGHCPVNTGTWGRGTGIGGSRQRSVKVSDGDQTAHGPATLSTLPAKSCLESLTLDTLTALQGPHLLPDSALTAYNWMALLPC